jgi:uncharacterized protein (DUF362 family)
MHPKRARREVAATPEVVKDLVESVIAAGKRVLTRDDPANLGREQLAQRVGVSAGVERVLRVMEPVEECCRGQPVQ